MGEKILVVNADAVSAVIPEGVTFTDVSSVFSMIRQLEPNLLVEDRDSMEGNPSYRQLIPYISLVYEGRYFSAVRTKNGEKRLSDLRTIGLGGHANMMPPTDPKYDGNLVHLLSLNAHREIFEELWVKDHIMYTFTGFINDLSTAVNRDHLGIYIIGRLNANDEVSIKEESALTDAKWMTTEELLEVDNLEYWSKLLLPKLI